MNQRQATLMLTLAVEKVRKSGFFVESAGPVFVLSSEEKEEIGPAVKLGDTTVVSTFSGHPSVDDFSVVERHFCKPLAP